MRKPQTKADYKRRIREVKRTSQKLTQSKRVKYLEKVKDDIRKDLKIK
jgi:hypothetical protein